MTKLHLLSASGGALRMGNTFPHMGESSIRCWFCWGERRYPENLQDIRTYHKGRALAKSIPARDQCCRRWRGKAEGNKTYFLNYQRMITFVSQACDFHAGSAACNMLRLVSEAMIVLENKLSMCRTTKGKAFVHLHQQTFARKGQDFDIPHNARRLSIGGPERYVQRAE